MNRLFFYFPLVVLFYLLTGCGYQPIRNQQDSVLYSVSEHSNNVIERYAPHFLIHDNHNTHNRIGKPSARLNKWNEEEIFIDVQHPTLYHAVDTFTTDRDSYTNYIYRIHFPGTPFSLIPFYLTSGNNPGLIVIITLNSDGKPVLVTNLHTCGCYLAIIPTSFLPKDAFPDNWGYGTLRIYGERLPPLLNYGSLSEPALLFTIRPDTHRIMGVELVDKKELTTGRFNTASLFPADMADLEKIPLADGTTSFFYQNDILAGHVKDSMKVWESLLLSVISLDLFVGTDKKYDFNFQTTNNFYTSLKPWNRISSDMRDFKRFLQFWGWKL